MNYVKMKNLKKIVAVPAFFAAAFSGLFAAPLPHWDPNLEYQKTAKFRIVFTNVRAETWRGNDIIYSGTTQFSVKRIEPRAAEITFKESDLFRLDTSPEFEIDRDERGWLKTLWEKTKTAGGAIRAKWNGEEVLIETTKNERGRDVFILKKDGLNKLVGLDAFSAETTNEFRNQSYCFRWNAENDATGTVYKDAKSDAALDTDHVVSDFVKSEVKFSYESLCEGRKENDEYWLVDGNVLSGLVPQSMLHKAGFKGRVVLHWIDSTPESRKIDSKLEKFDARIVICSRAKIGSSTESTRLEFFCENKDGKPQTMKIRKEEITGTFYVDRARRIVRYGEVKVRNAEYSGDMPKIGDFAEDIKKLSAKVSLDFEYTQEATEIKN